MISNKWTASRWVSAVVVAYALLLVSAVFAAPPVAVGPNSRLPYPSDADVWVDGSGTFNQPVAALPGGNPGMLISSSFIVFRPKGDSLKAEDFEALYVSNGYLTSGATPVFKATALPNSEAVVVANAKETFVYKTHVTGRWLVLGLIRNLRSQHQLASAVVLNGTLDSLQATSEANRLVELYAGEAQRRRQAPPMPAGTLPSGPSARWDGTKLAQLLQSIERDVNISARVKEMARTVIPQAVSINYSTWKTPAPMADQAFVDFYTQQAQKLGWGPPISTDLTQPGRPTILFQRPNAEGYVMIRAQPSPPGPVGTVTRPSTTLIVLDLESKKK